MGERTVRRTQISSDRLASTPVPLCRAFCSGDLGAAPARALLEAQVSWMRKHLTDLQGSLPTKTLKSELVELAFVALFEGAQITQDKAIHHQLPDLIVGDADLLPLQLAVLRASSGQRDGLHALGLAPVHAGALRTLAQQVDVPERAADDWSIVQPLRCAGDRCKVFTHACKRAGFRLSGRPVSGAGRDAPLRVARQGTRT